MNNALSVSTHENLYTMVPPQYKLDLSASVFLFFDDGLCVRDRLESLRLVDYDRSFERLVGYGCFRNGLGSSGLLMNVHPNAVTAKKVDEIIEYK